MKNDKIEQIYKEWLEDVKRNSKETNITKAKAEAEKIDEKYRKKLKEAL